MSWLLITIISYFLLAIVNLADKFLIDKVLSSSKVYAFLITIMGSIVLVIAPWVLVWPGWQLLIIQLISGALFPLALYLMFEALKRGDASKITVLIGGIIPIFSIALSYLFLQENFSLTQWQGVALLLFGTFLIALISENKGKKIISAKTAFYFSVASALAYALYFITTKYAYNHHDFLSSFIWIRVGSFIAALFFLIRARDRKEIFNGLKSGSAAKPKNRFLLIGNQALGAVSFVLQNYAISLGSVAIINALQGVQYAFLLIFGWLLTILRPKVLKENIAKRVLWRKIMAIILISIGLCLIAV